MVTKSILSVADGSRVGEDGDALACDVLEEWLASEPSLVPVEAADLQGGATIGSKGDVGGGRRVTLAGPDRP